MKVVFLEEVEGTASPGDIKNVADGFARNYLLPRRLAAPATEHYINIAQAKATKHARRQERVDEEARTHLLPKVEGRTFTVEVRVGEQGKLFGSVTGRDIAEAIQADTGIELGHQQVLLGQAIREPGIQEVNVRLTKNVLATINVEVRPLGAEEAEVEPTPAEQITSKPGPAPRLGESLVPETSAGAEAQDADRVDQIERTGSHYTSGDTGVGLEAVAEAAQVAEPQTVAETAAPDEEELEETGEPGG